MSKHTPGPWRAEFKSDATNNFGVYTQHGDLLATLNVHQLASLETVRRRHADARIMAAAPNLLKAADVALHWLQYANDPASYEVIESLISAINQAGGEA